MPPDGVALDVLVWHWWKALNAAQAALRGAGHYLAAEDLAERSRRFNQERSDVLRLLGRLGHDWQTESSLLDGLLDLRTPAAERLARPRFDVPVLARFTAPAVGLESE